MSSESAAACGSLCIKHDDEAPETVSLDDRELRVPHPTPYSPQFDAIRSAYPRLFERPGNEVPTRTHVASSDTTSETRHGCECKPQDK